MKTFSKEWWEQQAGEANNLGVRQRRVMKLLIVTLLLGVYALLVTAGALVQTMVASRAVTAFEAKAAEAAKLSMELKLCRETLPLLTPKNIEPPRPEPRTMDIFPDP
jgi:hypothetical protein